MWRISTLASVAIKKKPHVMYVFKRWHTDSQISEIHAAQLRDDLLTAANTVRARLVRLDKVMMWRGAIGPLARAEQKPLHIDIKHAAVLMEITP